ALLARVAPRRPAGARPAGVPAPRGAEPAAVPVPVPAAVSLLEQALGATPDGVSIVDVRLPDQPLVYVNAAFERLAGLPREQLVGRNCRFLQGPDTDPAAVAAVRRAVASGRECRVTMLNHRGPERTPWWNELHLTPVRGEDGEVAQYIGVQVDVTARVAAERALARERDRATAYRARIEELAGTDPVTGLPDRRRLAEEVETAIWSARAGDDALALLLVDVDGVIAANGLWGHDTGEDLLCAVADRVRAVLRRRDLVARLGGHEFVVVLRDLAPGTAGEEARRIAGELLSAVHRPVRLGGTEVPAGVRIGVSVFPEDGGDFPELLREAALRRFERPATTAVEA
ncbi:diguanylate cyclase domain-containing protein, partial [Geodermatophilus sp. CPCC 206100]|uniref:diguanylate cyclase domain-containing protein n=1 Tax=Geodermatophilus sp. CPCC 206100 TaxID=3020054 RepID=UPI003B00D0BF